MAKIKYRTKTKTVYRTRNKIRNIIQFPASTTQLSFQPTSAPSGGGLSVSQKPLINRFSGFVDRVKSAKSNLRAQLDQNRANQLARVQDESRRLREETRLLRERAKLAKLKKSLGQSEGGFGGGGFGGGFGGYY